jgi:alkaline phosphatase D
MAAEIPISHPLQQCPAAKAYIVGSCRYCASRGVPVRLMGDRIFASINQLIEGAEPPISATLMTGDQVYVDDLNCLAPDREWGHPQQVPCGLLAAEHSAFDVRHFDLYDPRITKSKTTGRQQNNRSRVICNAMAAYEIYQASHSPAHELTANGESGKLEQYWYQFSDGDIEWFVTDSRTRAILSADDRRILDAAQEQALSNG